MAGNQTAAPQVIVNTTTPNTVDLAYLTAPGVSVRVTNLNGAAPLYFTVDSPGGACRVPTVGGQSEFCAASIAGNSISTRAGDFQFGTIVQLISAGSVQYMVELQSIRATS